MPQFLVGTSRVLVKSFADGDRVVRVHAPARPQNDDEVMRYAVYLANHGRSEEADQYLGEYCGDRPAIRH